jgi:hypothetical protein
MNRRRRAANGVNIAHRILFADSSDPGWPVRRNIASRINAWIAFCITADWYWFNKPTAVAFDSRVPPEFQIFGTKHVAACRMTSTARAAALEKMDSAHCRAHPDHSCQLVGTLVRSAIEG